MTFRNYLTENAVAAELGKLSLSLDKKDELRSKIFQLYPKLKGIEQYFFEDTDPNSVSIKYNNLITGKYKKDLLQVADILPKQMGKFEVLMAFLGSNITANGGSGSFDLNLGSNKIEVKMAKYHKQRGGLYNFRFGVNNSAASGNVIKAMSNLMIAYTTVHRPRLMDKVLKNISKGIINIKDIDELREVNLSELKAKVEFKVNNSLDVFQRGKNIGSIEDKNTIEKIKQIAKTASLKSVEEIEDYFTKAITGAPYGYYIFLDTNKGGKCHYFPDLDDIKIMNITEGKVKILVRI